MSKENKTEIAVEIVSESDLTIDEDMRELMPSMNVGVPQKQAEDDEEKPSIVSDEQLLGVYGEILGNIRDDRKEVDQILSTFTDMVLNEGDATTSSKEAMVNLLKMKTDLADKMSKVADLMTRVKLKERDTYPRYLSASQNNTINIGDNQKRALLQALNKKTKKEDSE